MKFKNLNLVFFKKITVDEFVELNPLTKKNDLDRLIKNNTDVFFFKPQFQDFPIYKVTSSDDWSSSLETFRVDEYFTQKLEAPLGRWDKSWETCGIPKDIIKFL